MFWFNSLPYGDFTYNHPSTTGRPQTIFKVGNTKSPKKICWHFLVHFGIHAKSVPQYVRKHTGVDVKSKNDPKSQNKVKGQLSKIAYSRYKLSKFT